MARYLSCRVQHLCVYISYNVLLRAMPFIAILCEKPKRLIWIIKCTSEIKTKTHRTHSRAWRVLYVVWELSWASHQNLAKRIIRTHTHSRRHNCHQNKVSKRGFCANGIARGWLDGLHHIRLIDEFWRETYCGCNFGQCKSSPPPPPPSPTITATASLINGCVWAPLNCRWCMKWM